VQETWLHSHTLKVCEKSGKVVKNRAKYFEEFKKFSYEYDRLTNASLFRKNFNNGNFRFQGSGHTKLIANAFLLLTTEQRFSLILCIPKGDMIMCVSSRLEPWPCLSCGTH